MKDKTKDCLLTALNIVVLAIPILIAMFFRGLNKELFDKVMVYSGAAISLAFILSVDNVITLRSNKVTEESMRYIVQPWLKKVRRGFWHGLFIVTIISLFTAAVYVLMFGISTGLNEEIKWKSLFEIGTYASFVCAFVCNLFIIGLFKKYQEV